MCVVILVSNLCCVLWWMVGEWSLHVWHISVSCDTQITGLKTVQIITGNLIIKCLYLNPAIQSFIRFTLDILDQNTIYKPNLQEIKHLLFLNLLTQLLELFGTWQNLSKVANFIYKIKKHSGGSILSKTLFSMSPHNSYVHKFSLFFYF